MYKHQSPGTAKKGQIILIADVGPRYVWLRLLKILAFLVIVNLAGFTLFWTPLVGFILTAVVDAIGFALAVWGVIALILYRIGGVAITTDGIFGMDMHGKRYDLCFDQIQSFERKGRRIHISADVITKRGRVKRREFDLSMSNVEQFVQAYENR